MIKFLEIRNSLKITKLKIKNLSDSLPREELSEITGSQIKGDWEGLEKLAKTG